MNFGNMQSAAKSFCRKSAFSGGGSSLCDPVPNLRNHSPALCRHRANLVAVCKDLPDNRPCLRAAGQSTLWKYKSIYILAALLLAVSFSSAATYFVAASGNDANPGTSLDQPFQTLQRAAAVLEAGDVCLVRAGVYRETVKLTRSGQRDKPITFAAYQAEQVILDGSDLVAGPWTKTAGGIWSANIPGTNSVEAVFCDGRMMTEARWPNCSWEDNWESDKKWAVTDKGSNLGQIQSAALAKSGQDLTGGLLYIRLSKGNNCFTRPVTSHRPGESMFLYDKTGIEGRAWGEDAMPERIKRYGFSGNRFFVVARGALDAPGEWWHEVSKSQLLFIPPDGGNPDRHQVSFKTRVAGFESDSVTDVLLDGLEFRACNIRFAKAKRITLRNCRFIYPATPKIFVDAKTSAQVARNLRIEGNENNVDHCLIEWAVDGALEIEGNGNRIENCIVHDCNLHGRHAGPGISVCGTGTSNIIRRNTVYNCGGVGIYPLGAQSATVESNHIFNCGLYCVDVSSIYVPVGAKMQGTRIHHNWLHDLNGLGFRVDIQGRDITFDHNLVWNATIGCKLQGYQLAGYNNTVLVNDPKLAFIVVFEPEATVAERAGWRIQNNVAHAFLDRLSLRDDPRQGIRPFILPLKTEPRVIDHNVTLSQNDESRFFVDFAHNDFRPRPGGPLDAAGVAIPGIATGKPGRPPSIGALETGGITWIAGADWMDDDLAVPATAQAATELARSLRPASYKIGLREARYEKQ